MIKRSVIYGIKNLINNKIYVGSAEDWESRKSWHIAALKRNGHFNEHLQNSWNKYGEINFSIEPIEDVPKYTNESDFEFKLRLVDGREQHYIDFFNASIPKNGYNIRKKASSALGLKRSESTKKLMSEVKLGSLNPMFGKTFSKKALQKLSDSKSGDKHWLFGKNHTEETKQLIRERSKVECTDETRRKLSEASKKNGTNKPRSVVVFEKIYKSLSAAGRDLNINKDLVSYRCSRDNYPDYKFVESK